MEKQRTVHRCLEMTKNTREPVVDTFQHFEKSQISAKRRGLRPSIWAWERITHNPAVWERERERENHWLSCAHVMFSVTDYWYCKTSLIYPDKIYQKCFLVLQNTHRTSYLQSKVLLYGYSVTIYIFLIYEIYCQIGFHTTPSALQWPI